MQQCVIFGVKGLHLYYIKKSFNDFNNLLTFL